jgi:ABC-type sugar transport system permease subunit
MTLTYYLYRQGFQYRNMGYASAVSVIFFIVVVGISVVVKKLMKAR